MMTRRKLSALPLLALGSLNLPGQSIASDNFVVDDGLIDLRPQFLVNYVLGESTLRVQCGFDSLSLKKIVLLGTDGLVSINGVPLKVTDSRRRDNYEARVSAESDMLKIKITRTKELSTTFDIAVPKFTITHHPKTLKHTDDLELTLVPQTLTPVYRLVENHFWMRISDSRSTVVSLRELRAPTKNDPTLVLRSLGIPFTGPYQDATAKLVRHNRVALKDVTADYKSGWVVLTVTHEFPIDVL
jgi:hypothetical protein